MKPGDILTIAFRRKFGLDAPPAQQAATSAVGEMPEEPLENETVETPQDYANERMGKALSTEMLTDVQGTPPVGPADVANVLRALSMFQRANGGGSDDALAVG